MEALQCIYMDDLQIIYQDPLFLFEITITNSDEVLLARLSITMPPADYPNTIPEIKIVKMYGETMQKISDLEALIRKESEQRIGNCMIYEICEVVKEIIEGQIIKGQEIEE